MDKRKAAQPGPYICACGAPGSSSPRKNRKGWIEYKRKCRRCIRALEPKRSYQKNKKPHCEKCGFVAVDPCQLDIDHIDGDHYNNDPSNWQTLCANCHRLKTSKSRALRPLQKSSPSGEGNGELLG